MLLSFFFPSECLEAPACELTDAVLTPPGAASRVLWSTSEAWQATADRQGLGWTEKTRPPPHLTLSDDIFDVLSVQLTDDLR